MKMLTEAEDVQFEGEIGAKVLAFKSSKQRLFLAYIISGEEGEAWKACEEMLAFSVKQAEAQLHGFFGLELLTCSLRESLQNFSAPALAQLIVNHAKKLEPGQKTQFPYGRFHFCLMKRILNDWGKIDFKTYVEVYRKPRAQLDLLIKQKVKEVVQKIDGQEEPAELYIVDLSREGLFRFGDDEQTARLASYLKKCQDDCEKRQLRLMMSNTCDEPIDLFEQFNTC